MFLENPLLIVNYLLLFLNLNLKYSEYHTFSIIKIKFPLKFYNIIILNMLFI